jgi:hypothetical protein
MNSLPISLIVKCRYIGATKTKNSRIGITVYFHSENKIKMEKSFQSCLDFSGNTEINTAYDYAATLGKAEWDKEYSTQGFQFNYSGVLKAELNKNTFIYLFQRIV